MKHSELSFLFAVVTVAGCVEVDDPELELDEASIVNGAARAPEAFGVALVSSSCSATMITNDIALTTSGCGVTGNLVVVGTSRSKVRNVRVPRRSTGDDAAIVAIQMQKPLALINGNGLTTSDFLRTVDTRPLKQGDSVSCRGFSGGRLRDGLFDVIDGSSDTLVKLRGRQAGGGNLWQVSKQDLGGFCARDGGGIAAILTGETGIGDIAQAIPVHDLAGGLNDMEVARDASQDGVAIRLRDDKAQRFLTAMPNTDRVMAQAAPSTDPGQRDQAFYLDKITNPFAQGTWHRLVDARSGRCLTVVNASFLTQQTCNTSSRDQMFFIGSTQVNGFDRYIVFGTGGQADADGAPSVAMRSTPSSGAILGSQQFEMWLTPL